MTSAAPPASDKKHDSVTVARYLQLRLQELDAQRLFTVGGNYMAAFLDTILADEHRKLQINGMVNELIAGYAADAFARIRTADKPTVGVVAVTYGVGALSMIQTTAGSNAEHVPVVIINGAPTAKERLNLRMTGLTGSHMEANQQSNLECFRPVTGAAVRITNANEAPAQIDEVLTACITYSLPVYLEVAEDVWRIEVPHPKAPLPSTITVTTVTNTSNAIDATLKIIDSFGDPVLWAGIEVQRLRCRNQFIDLITDTNLAFTTDLLAKSLIVPEEAYYKTKQFCGIYTPSSPDVKTGISSIDTPITTPYGNAKCLIGIGAWAVGNPGPIGARNVVLAAYNGVYAGAQFFASVPLADFITGLREKINAIRQKDASALAPASASSSGGFLSVLAGGKKFPNSWRTSEPVRHVISVGSGPGLRKTVVHDRKDALTAAASPPVAGMTYDIFFDQLQNYMNGYKGSLTLVSDIAFVLSSTTNMSIRELNGFLTQASWLSIGYAAGAAIGVKMAQPKSRAIVVTGDGAFQETCQAISAYNYYGQNTVLFVLANGIYGIEQAIVNAYPFRKPTGGDTKAAPVKPYPPPFGTVFEYNDLHDWDYAALANVMGKNKKGEQVAVGHTVNNMKDLEAVWKDITAHPDRSFVVTIRVPKTDFPSAAGPLIASVGEDEIPNPQWPPSSVF